MKKRKISLIIIAIAMAFCMALFVFLPACNSGNKDEDNEEQNQEQSGGDVDPGAGGDGSGSGNEGSSGSKDVNQEELPSTTIYMVGDSTMCGFTDTIYIPRYGYGTQMYNYFYDAADYSEDGGNTGKVTIRNLAVSGKSSQTFLTQSQYTVLEENISEGDYLIIGFGHNDEKSGDTFTSAELGYGESTEETISFADSLYDNYIALAESVGATPILCTPIVRYSSSADYSGDKAHNTDTGDYAQAIRDLGKETGTTVIDLTAITKEDYTSLGTDAQWYHSFGSADATSDTTAPMAREIETTESHHADPDDETDVDDLKYQLVVPGSRDDTHLNKYGAKMVAYEFAEALAETDNSLADYVLTSAVKPSIENDFNDVYNPDYLYREYSSFNPETDASSSYTGLPDGWYGTYFGDISSGNTSVSYTAASSGDGLGTFTVGAASATRGKVAGSSDGVVAAFMQLDRYQNFEFTVNAKITGSLATSNYNQMGFGVMLRDDIYIDKQDSSINSNYVTAGAIGAADGNSSFANFYRKDTKLVTDSDATLPSLFNASDYNEFELKMVRENETITCTITPKNGTEVTSVRNDISYYDVDSDYVYLCLFVARGLTVEYSGAVYTETGLNTGA